MKHFQTLGVPFLLVLTMFSAMLCSIAPVSAMSSPPIPVHRAARPVSLPRPDLKAEAQWFQLSHFGKTWPAANARILALQQASALPRLRGPWKSLGPAPVNSSGCNTCRNPYGLNSGRITALAVNPTNSSDLWAGAADGGAWHSTDGGAHWTPVSDSWPTLSIGAIAFDPSNANTIYVGTGEANYTADAYWGAGIFKTTDGGAHWTQLGFSNFGGLGISKIAVDPNNSSNILVAAGLVDGNATGVSRPAYPASSQGIWRSTDAGSTWAPVKTDGPTPAPPYGYATDAGTDVLFDPAHPGVAFAGLGNIQMINSSFYTSLAGVYKSVDSGATWTRLSTGIPTGNSIARVSLGISHDGQHLYGVLTDAGANAGGSVFGNLLNSAIYVSTTNGSTWTAQNVSGVTGMVTDDGGSQWLYDTYAAVDPTDSTGNTAYVGGVDVWQTTTGGASWTNLTNAYNLPGEGTFAGVHPDQHALAFLSTSSSSYYIGNDGGVWSGTSGGSFTNRNSGGLNITQFYSGSIGEVGTHAHLYGGAQDNGEDQFPLSSALAGPTQWNEVFGGSGGDTVVDYTDNSVVYEEDVFGAISKSVDGGATWNPATTGISRTDPVNFMMPFIISPNNHLELLAGTDRVYRTTNGASNWVPISPILDGGAAISALAIAPGNENVIYVGDDLGNLFVTTNGGGSWLFFPVPGSTGSLIGTMVTGLAVDPINPLIVYASFPDFATPSFGSGAGQHVFRSTNGGTSWTDISTTLPNIPFESIMVSPRSSQLVVAGSDAGIFASFNGGTTWRQLGSGLPNVAIDQVFTNHTGTSLFVATHGRGLWEFPLNQML
jgi:photosystem II stability/assembly factor-like uncharacterized protein